MIQFKCPTLPVFPSTELLPTVSGHGGLVVMERNVSTIYYHTVHAHHHGSYAQAFKWSNAS